MLGMRILRLDMGMDENKTIVCLYSSFPGVRASTKSWTDLENQGVGGVLRLLRHAFFERDRHGLEVDFQRRVGIGAHGG